MNASSHFPDESHPFSLPEADEPEDLAGQTLDVCFLEKKIGSGGMGSVYLAKHLTLHKRVALKVLPPELSRNRRLVERFFREARSAAQLEHPNIVQVYDVRATEKATFIVMQYIEGTTLREKVESDTLSFKEKLSIVYQVAQGLSFAHQRNIIHRDIKADNVLISNLGEVKIADFGLAKAVDEFSSQLTTEGQILGTPDYMPPEICLGKSADTRSDIYSMGVLFYFTFAKRLPFEGDNVPSLLLQHLNDEPPSLLRLNPEVSPSLNYVILKMLQKEPEHRYLTVEELLEDLKIVLSGQAFKSTKIQSIFHTLPKVPQPKRVNSSILMNVLDSTHETTHQLKTFFEQVPLKKRLPFFLLGTVILFLGILWLFWPAPTTSEEEKEPKGNVVHKKEPPQEEPWLILKKQLDTLLSENHFLEARHLLLAQMNMNPEPTLLSAQQEWLKKIYLQEILWLQQARKFKESLQLCLQAFKDFPGDADLLREERSISFFLLAVGELSPEETQQFLQRHPELQKHLQEYYQQKIQNLLAQNAFEDAERVVKFYLKIYQDATLKPIQQQIRLKKTQHLLQQLELAINHNQPDAVLSLKEQLEQLSPVENAEETQMLTLLQGWESQQFFSQMLEQIREANETKDYEKVNSLYENYFQHPLATPERKEILSLQKQEFTLFFQAFQSQQEEKTFENASRLYESYLQKYPEGDYLAIVQNQYHELKCYLDVKKKIKRLKKVALAEEESQAYLRQYPEGRYVSQIKTLVKSIREREFLEIRLFQKTFYPNTLICIRVYKIKDQEATELSADKLSFHCPFGSFQRNFFQVGEPGEYTIQVTESSSDLKATEKIIVSPPPFSERPRILQARYEWSFPQPIEPKPLLQFELRIFLENKDILETSGIALTAQVSDASLKEVKSMLPQQNIPLKSLQEIVSDGTKYEEKLFFEEVSLLPNENFYYLLIFQTTKPELFQAVFQIQCAENRRLSPPIELQCLFPFKPKEKEPELPIKPVRPVPQENRAANTLWAKAQSAWNDSQTPFGLFSKQGKISEAINTYYEIMERYPNSTRAEPAAFELGRIYLSENNKNGAIDAFKKCLEFNPETKENVRLILGNIYIDLNNREEAKYWYKRATQESSSEQERKTAKIRLEALK